MADLIGEELQKFAKPEEVSSIIESFLCIILWRPKTVYFLR
jgi:hypothetical protein